MYNVCMPSERAKIVGVILVGVALIVPAAPGIATAWLLPAGVGALAGMATARFWGQRRRNA